MNYWVFGGLLALIAAPISEGIRFNRESFAVWLDLPQIAHNESTVFFNTSYTVKDLEKLVERVASKFSIIMLDTAIDTHNSGMREYISAIPGVVANFNKFQVTNGGGGEQRPLELILSYLPRGETRPEVASMEFENVKKLADRANSVFPNTVKMLLLWDLRYQSGPYGSSGIRYEYEVGSTLHLERCTLPGRFGPYVTFTISSSSTLFLFHQVGDRHLEMGAEDAFSEITDLFRSCKERVLQLNPNVTVGLLADWKDTTEAGVQNISSLAHFWSKMNSWSSATGTKVIMYSAFDLVYYSDLRSEMPSAPQWATSGWWKLKSVPSSPDSPRASGFVIQEKISAAGDPPEGGQSYGMVTISLVVVLILLVVLAIAGIVTMVVLRRKRQPQ